MKAIKDGWHTIYGIDAYIENGCVKRGLSSDGQRTIYPYKAAKSGGWDLDQYMSVDYFRRKLSDGSARWA